MPTDNRATAERIAPFTLTDADRYTKRNSTTFEQDIVDAVNEDRKHHSRTVEREAITDERMRAAWDEAYRRVNPPVPKAAWPEYHPASIAWHREFIAVFLGLAAESDASSAVNDDRKARDVAAHRDRTAEREAAKKAIDHMGEQPRSESSRDWTLARDRYLAAEFDAGERVTLSDGSVVTRRYSHIEEADVLVHDENGNGRNYPLRDFPNILRSVHTGADFDAVKRLAEQRGAER